MTQAHRPEALLRSLAGRVAVSLSTVALRLGRFATARDRVVRPEWAAHPSAWDPPDATVIPFDRGA